MNSLKAEDYNLNDTIYSETNNYIICINNGKKMWKKYNSNEELQKEEYIIGNLSNTKELTKIEEYFNDININPTPIKKKSIYHQFIKDKIKEYSEIYPSLTKKERYSKILEEWKAQK